MFRRHENDGRLRCFDLGEHLCVRMYANIYVCVYTYVYDVYVYMYMYTYIYIFIYVYMYICICVYMYTFYICIHSCHTQRSQVHTCHAYLCHTHKRGRSHESNATAQHRVLQYAVSRTFMSHTQRRHDTGTKCNSSASD